MGVDCVGSGQRAAGRCGPRPVSLLRELHFLPFLAQIGSVTGCSLSESPVIRRPGASYCLEEELRSYDRASDEAGGRGGSVDVAEPGARHGGEEEEGEAQREIHSSVRDGSRAEEGTPESLLQIVPVHFEANDSATSWIWKMDKASVLGDAVKYLKQLQEKVKALEDEVAKRNVESAVLVKKSKMCGDENGSSTCDEEVDAGQCGEPLPEIEARVCQKTMLIKIHCDNRKGILVKVLSEIEKLHLSVMSTSAMPFAAAALDITVMTQIEEEFSMTAKEVVKKLSSALRQFM
ncbi:transcription factor bHLH18-like [Canna indica]|uniref:Transcription factor bHLH18-like n=1 Tax=Canna indica TaxID=4628 RepID=A0AAQ3JZX9_9LILI|nr:transcription factor bHLH18-like [Canna indica]